jgi:glyoxylase-like metal-dependent hydrolase (beta-lactamase superfamily II)
MTQAEKALWSEPGMEQVQGQIYRLPLPLPMDELKAVNVYAIVADEGITLIDGGWAIPEADTALTAALAEFGAETGDIRRILVTHLHRDHYTQAVAIRRRFDVEVMLGSDERRGIDLIRDWVPGTVGGHTPFLGKMGAAALHAHLVQDEDWTAMSSQSYYEYPDRWLDDGEVISCGEKLITAVTTPGHTNGHMIYLLPSEGVLFSGDHILPHITPSIGFEPARPAYPLRDYLSSLEKVLRLPDLKLLPAHGDVTESSHVRVHELLEHHRIRLDETLNALGEQPRPAAVVATTLAWTRRKRRLDELNEFNQGLAVAETSAHLDVLVLQGRAVQHVVDDVTMYTSAAN